MATIYKPLLGNLSENPEVTSSQPETRFLAEIADAFHEWLEAENEEDEAWEEPLTLDLILGKGVTVYGIALDTETHTLTYTFDNGQRFRLTCEEVK